MATYYMEIDDGQGGSDTCEADSLREAVAHALEWAADGDWSIAQHGTEDQYGGCGDPVVVRVWREEERSAECAWCSETATAHDDDGDPACAAHAGHPGPDTTLQPLVEAVAVEEDTAEYTIPTLGDVRDSEIDDAGTVLAEREHEFSTERLVRVDDEYYLAHPNGGSRGAYDRMCGDGVWRDHPVEPTRVLDRAEARQVLLDWDYSPAEVARMTRG